MVTRCLGDDTIAAMLEGVLNDELARGARAHIGTCDACRRIVSAAIEVDRLPAGDPPTASGAVTRDARAPGHSYAGLAPGTVIAGRYLTERAIGDGGMGCVFAARQLGLDRAVAIKILRPELARDAMALSRFQREARLVASLTSEHVVRVHDFGALDSGEPFLVMELLDGEDLATVVGRGPISVEQAIAWILAACDAIGEAHSLGIVHRDLKPSNIMLTRQGRIKVLDFGLAKLAQRRTGALTHEGMLLGSPHYMAPEQVTGARDVDLRVDIWSLGATLYHLVAGTPPFAAPTVEAVLANIVSGGVSPAALERLRSLGVRYARLVPVIGRALARDPAARFATIGDFAGALAAARTPRSHARTWVIATVAATAIAGVGVAIAVSKSSSADGPQASTPGSAPTPAPTAMRSIDSGPVKLPFSFTRPDGWRFATDVERARLGLTPDMIMLLAEKPTPSKKHASLIVTELDELDAGEMTALFGGTVAYCAELGEATATESVAALTSAKPTKLAGLTGCDVLAVKQTGLAIRSLSLSNGKHAIALVCSRDSSGDSSVDAACLAVAGSFKAQ